MESYRQGTPVRQILSPLNYSTKCGPGFSLAGSLCTQPSAGSLETSGSRRVREFEAEHLPQVEKFAGRNPDQRCLGPVLGQRLISSLRMEVIPMSSHNRTAP